MKYKQNKTINLVLTIVLTLSLCLIPLTVSYADEPFEHNATTGLDVRDEFATVSSAFDPNRLANLDISRELYVKLIDSFSQEPIPSASDYPNWYGGSFMNDQGKLVICVTPEYSEGLRLLKVKAEVISIVGSDDILFEPCEYSFRYLTETMDYLNSIMLDTKRLAVSDNLNNFGICDKENRIFVFLENCDESSIKMFSKNVDDLGCIIFAKSKGSLVKQVNVKPGNGIETYAGSESMAYRARHNGVDGIVTAGHVATSTATGYNWVDDSSGTNFAECTKRQESGSVDAAFCKIVNQDYVPSNDIMSGTMLTSTLNPGYGDVIYKRGAFGGLTSGTVLSTNWSGGGLTNLTQASYASVDGDSGGIVFTFSMSNNTGYTVGIHLGLGNGKAVYTKASLANSALGITRY